MPRNDDATAEKDGLNAKQAKALSALLSAPTLEKAAAACGQSESTLLRYLKNEAFAVAYREARRELVSLAVTGLQRAAGDAVTVLVAVAQDSEAPASSRVSAARTVLDLAIRAVELDDLQARVEALEGVLKANGN
jgi:ABC-type phosphate transport system permease subunit